METKEKGEVQFEVGRHPAWLDGRDIGAGYLAVGKLIGEVAEQWLAPSRLLVLMFHSQSPVPGPRPNIQRSLPHVSANVLPQSSQQATHLDPLVQRRLVDLPVKDQHVQVVAVSRQRYCTPHRTHHPLGVLERPSTHRISIASFCFWSFAAQYCALPRSLWYVRP